MVALALLNLVQHWHYPAYHRIGSGSYTNGIDMHEHSLGDVIYYLTAQWHGNASCWLINAINSLALELHDNEPRCFGTALQCKIF